MPEVHVSFRVVLRRSASFCIVVACCNASLKSDMNDLPAMTLKDGSTHSFPYDEDLDGYHARINYTRTTGKTMLRQRRTIV